MNEDLHAISGGPFTCLFPSPLFTVFFKFDFLWHKQYIYIGKCNLHISVDFSMYTPIKVITREGEKKRFDLRNETWGG